LWRKKQSGARKRSQKERQLSEFCSREQGGPGRTFSVKTMPKRKDPPLIGNDHLNQSTVGPVHVGKKENKSLRKLDRKLQGITALVKENAGATAGETAREVRRPSRGSLNENQKKAKKKR